MIKLAQFCILATLLTVLSTTPPSNGLLLALVEVLIFDH